MRRARFTPSLTLIAGALLHAQSSPVEFEVVSIKRSAGDTRGASTGTAPDGTFRMHNMSIRSILPMGSPVPTREVEGAPAWVERENYDIIARPPAGTTRQQLVGMMRRLLEDRFKLKGHVEERERTVFALVLARSDGRLGPQLTPSTLDCTTMPPEPRCGSHFGPGTQMTADGVDLNLFALQITGVAGGQVINRTGLQGQYAATLRWAPSRPPDPDAPVDERPAFPTALQEQLGLKLQPEKTKLPVFVVDSIERPSEN